MQVEDAKVLEQLINPWSLHLQDGDEIEGGAEAPRIAGMAQVQHVESLAVKKAGNRRNGKIVQVRRRVDETKAPIRVPSPI